MIHFFKKGVFNDYEFKGEKILGRDFLDGCGHYHDLSFSGCRGKSW
jgi:hypothetical protein